MYAQNHPVKPIKHWYKADKGWRLLCRSRAGTSQHTMVQSKKQSGSQTLEVRPQGELSARPTKHCQHLTAWNQNGYEEATTWIIIPTQPHAIVLLVHWTCGWPWISLPLNQQYTDIHWSYERRLEGRRPMYRRFMNPSTNARIQNFSSTGNWCQITIIASTNFLSYRRSLNRRLITGTQ
jgi:hypothetical protein